MKTAKKMQKRAQLYVGIATDEYMVKRTAGDVGAVYIIKKSVTNESLETTG